MELQDQLGLQNILQGVVELVIVQQPPQPLLVVLVEELQVEIMQGQLTQVVEVVEGLRQVVPVEPAAKV